MGELAQWKSHKSVRAGKIIGVPVSGELYEVEDANGAPTKVNVPSGFCARGFPTLGDYIVIYADGYKSWSPAKAFEEGYDRFDEAKENA